MANLMTINNSINRAECFHNTYLPRSIRHIPTIRVPKSKESHEGQCSHSHQRMYAYNLPIDRLLYSTYDVTDSD